MTPQELALLLHIPVGTLYAWRHKGLGPPAVRVGRHLRYRTGDVEAWLDERSRMERQSLEL